MTTQQQHLHILGIGGTFMGSLSLLAKSLGYHVTGSDGPLYPPMSDLLHRENIELHEGYGTEILDLHPDCIVVGNALKRGMPIIEALLNQRAPLISGPQWLSEKILNHKTRVLGVAGTHGKTTTSSLLAWILTQAGYNPGFLIGGVSKQLKQSAQLGDTAPDGHTYFVLECDEYDSAFFDKRSKFVHYRPNVTILNNLEFDHADIFPDLSAIEQQFHHLVRVLPSEGLIITPESDPALERVLARGCWTPVSTFSKQTTHPEKQTAEWGYETLSADGHHWNLLHKGEIWGTVKWHLLGTHNQQNAVAAIAAAAHIGISPTQSIQALAQFEGVKRRLEIRHTSPSLMVYDDFAHHPTAIYLTLAGLRAKVDKAPIIVVVDISSNTMKKGSHQGHFKQALQAADAVFFYQNKVHVAWDIVTEFSTLQKPGGVHKQMPALLQAIQHAAKQFGKNQVHLLGMSNGNLEPLYLNFST
jgi:UDP-N-acetylmuramate: L-alanyl-gamma-D-glutamyl-meso-diaminopimelate ligase